MKVYFSIHILKKMKKMGSAISPVRTSSEPQNHIHTLNTPRFNALTPFETPK